MATYFLWGSIGLLVVSLVIGFFVGFGRGIKRSSCHVLFLVASIIIAFFITKPVTNAIMGISIPVDGGAVPIKDYILQMIQENMMDLSSFDSASAFIQNLPTVIASPIIFFILMFLVYIVMDIIYLVVARISFGKKSKDFENHKPHRLPGAVIGLIEAFMFILVLFAPITSLTNTYSEILSLSEAQAQTLIIESEGGEGESGQSERMQTIGELVGSNIPQEVNDAIMAYNNSAIGKICALGGFDDAMFDGLSSLTIDGEKIYIRDELVSLADTYDSFVVVYNQVYIDKDYANINVSTLKKAVTHVIENNLFKTVIANTLQDLVLNYDEIFNNEENPIEVPAPFDEIIKALQTRFGGEDFNPYEYLKSDLLTILDIAEDVVSNNGIGKIVDINMEDISSILNYATTENALLSSSLKSFVGLNLVTDTLPILLEYANDQLEPNFANDQGLVVALNENITIEELQAVITELLEGDNAIISQVKTLDENYNVIDLISSDDILNDILNTKGISNALVDLGKIADKANNLKLFSYTTQNGEVKALENLLVLNGFNILDDKVNKRDESGEVTGEETLDTFEKVFTYLKEPIDNIINSGLTNLLNSEVDFDEVLDIMTENISGTEENGFEKNYDFIADILMPFYELDEMTIQGQTVKAIVFDNVKNMLDKSLGEYIDLSTTEETDNYETWRERFVSVAKLLDSLNDGEMEVEGQQAKQTYLEYMLSQNADYFELITTMNEDGAVDNLLNVIFGNKMYAPINQILFSTLATEVGGFTGVEPASDYSEEKLYTQSADYIKVIKTIISNLETLINMPDDIFTNADSLKEPFEAIGEILDTLKTSAKNGVFKELYINLVWYVTGDVIEIETHPTYQDQVSPFEYADKVSEFLKADELSEGYFDDEFSFGDKIADLVDFIKLGNQIATSLGENAGNLNTEEGIKNFVEDIKTTLEEIEDPVAIVETAVDLVDVVLTEEQKAEISEKASEVKTAIDKYIEENASTLDENIKNALGALKGLFVENTQGAESGV